MFDYLQKFNTLPKNLRDSVSSPAAMSVISDLENKYKIDLAATVMKVMIKIIPLADLSIYFVSEFSLDQEIAKKLTAELKERLFFSVANYLGYNPSYSLIVPKTTPAPAHLLGVEKVIKDSGIIFPGTELNARLKQVLTTYLKGVRSRIDTRLTLNKEVISGGLGLDYKVIDKIFKSADEIIAGNSLPSGQLAVLPKTESVTNGLDKVRALYEKQESVRDIPYDLKKAIATGAIKKPETPLNLPIPLENKEKLLEEPDERFRIAAAPIILKTESVTQTPIKTEPIKISPIKAEPVLSSPKIEIKLSEGNKIPEVKNFLLPKTPVIPVVAPIVSPVTKAIEPATNFIPADHKITRPPEKKAGIFSKLFSNEPKESKTIEEKKPEIKKAASPIISVASLRNEALKDNQPKNPVIKTTNPINSDVRSVPKIMGPIEELAYLDIINFRRLGLSPIEAVAKVESKIKLLEKDGYDKMIEGVMAWRSGIINNIYLKMGLESLSKGISLKQCADGYQSSKNTTYLTWEEIEQIMALNSRLMF